MSPTPASPRRLPRGVGSLALLAVLGGLFGFLANWPHYEGLILMLAGVGAGGALQRLGPSWVRAFAPVAVVVVFTAVALESPLGLLPELVAGGGGVAVLLWLADDPGRPAGGVARAQNTLGIPALALGIAWASALLLPSSSASLGVAVGLLVFVIVAVAYLFGRPTLFDHEEPSPS